MPPVSSLAERWHTRADSIRQRRAVGIALLVVLHLAALGVMLWSEIEPAPMAGFLLTWALLNFVWLTLIRRPALAAAISLAMIAVLIAVSHFKHSVIWMTANFIDVMVIDSETVTFLWAAFPKLRVVALVAVIVGTPLAALIWWIDPLRVRRPVAALGAALSLAGLIGLSLTVPLPPGQMFGDENYVSVFARSGVEAAAELVSHGILESDPLTADRLKLGMEDQCQPAGKPPHIILVLDESSFDIRAANGIKVPEGYGRHFRSFDGKTRQFLVEGAGGPSWYTEYNVLSGLSSRSFGRFQFFVTRIAAGRVERGLPHALRRCGYRTFSIYPVAGNFLGARTYYKGAGFQHFFDGADIRGAKFEPDRFYFDLAARMINRERSGSPLFLFVYLTANHFPWDWPFHPELTPGWRNPGNKPAEVDEYLRRQSMTERDYADFLARLERDFPGEPFLVVRFGDHQPDFAKLVIDPTIDAWEIGNRLLSFDPRYYRTYYAIDAINFLPVDLSSALDLLDAPYLPLVVQEAAGLPLDPTFVEQKRILQRCKGLFYGCGGGAEARRFNRLLIDAGLIKGL